ncbi:MAG: MerR family transcriptional regulator [Clostridiales Family XIII bacterium]|nr:MerR family transcriptional regulator [Clostridiales Family XIII bacterium]
MKRKTRYTIGELSEISNISTKTLRLYDEKGVLTPQGRDSDNNYRYYTEKQVIDALTLCEMRRNGFHMSELKRLMDIDDIHDSRNNLCEKIEKIEEEIRSLEDKATYVRNTLSIIDRSISIIENYNANNDLVIDESPEMTVLFTRYRSNFNANQLFWDRYLELHRIKDELGLTALSPLCAIFHDNYFNQFFFDEGDLEVYIQIAEQDRQSPSIKVKEPFVRASKVFSGWYADLLDGYVTLVKEIERNGYIIDGPSHEEYLLEFAYGFNTNNYYTRVSFPVKKA